MHVKQVKFACMCSTSAACSMATTGRSTAQSANGFVSCHCISQRCFVQQALCRCCSHAQTLENALYVGCAGDCMWPCSRHTNECPHRRWL
jgi:hypothetical protein